MVFWGGWGGGDREVATRERTTEMRDGEREGERKRECTWCARLEIPEPITALLS